jgi:Cu+-exporting ATPase
MLRALLILALLALSSCAGERFTPAADGPERAPRGGPGDASSADTKPASTPPELVTLEVGGMTCQACVLRVSEKLSSVPGVHRVDVSLDQQRAVVLADRAVADTALTGAVRRAGSEFLGIVVKR